MIKFSLICDCNAKFEGWFPSNEDYENQLAQGQLLCPMCDSTKVRKDIMSPNIKKKSTKTPRQRGKDAVKNMTGEHFTMGGRARTFLDTIKILFKQLKKKEKINFITTPKNIRKHYQYFTKANINKLKKNGYKKKFKDLENGIKLFVKENKDNY